MVNPAAIAGYTLVWSDAFAGIAGTNGTYAFRNWNAMETDHGDAGNHEVQTYGIGLTQMYMDEYFDPGPDKNSAVSHGLLHLIPTYVDTWHSGRLEGKKAFGCPDGKSMIMEASLKAGNTEFDNQAGVWPAFWALGETFRQGTNWPSCGEWDIFETAHGADWALGSLHWGGANPDERPSRSSSHITFDTSKFHKWRITVDRKSSNWQDQTLEWSLDGQSYWKVKGSDIQDEASWKVLAHQAYYPVLNVAIGSNFPEAGQPDDATVSAGGFTTWPNNLSMTVEYVAVWNSA